MGATTHLVASVRVFLKIMVCHGKTSSMESDYCTDCLEILAYYPTEDFPAVPQESVMGEYSTGEYLTVNHTVGDCTLGQLPIGM